MYGARGNFSGFAGCYTLPHHRYLSSIIDFILSYIFPHIIFKTSTT